jgi:ankyrin repeat protein
MRTVGLLAVVLSALFFGAAQEPNIDYDVARSHELQPHRRTIPTTGVSLNNSMQIQLELTVSQDGEVVGIKPEAEPRAMRQWPWVRQEIEKWRFTPFLANGKPVQAQVKEYVDLVPPERLPVGHIEPPPLGPDSHIVISLQRSGCYGTCPSYGVWISSHGISFDGRHFVVASGKHRSPINAEKVRTLAQMILAADFYSMDDCYCAGVTDNPTYQLSISIDGREKRVQDYVGAWVGMPAVIEELEDEVDRVSESARWVSGADGLVEALKGEGFDFHSPDAQLILKRAAFHKEATTVRELIRAGVPIEPLPAKGDREVFPMELDSSVGVLTAASDDPSILKTLIGEGASKDRQEDKNRALSAAAGAGVLESVRLLIAYGADPNADLRSDDERKNPSRDAYRMNGPGSVLIQAAYSGNPEVVQEILRYHPDLEGRGFRQETAIFFVGESRASDKPGARVECLRFLAAAGANVNARNYDGDTPLHRIYLPDVEEELLKLGADVNARNNDGETPIFTNVDDDSVALFAAHGADLTIRNKRGQSLLKAAKAQGPLREQAVKKVLHASGRK